MKSSLFFILLAVALLVQNIETIAQKVVVVSATKAWNSTGIRTTSGQQLLIFARGIYSNGYNNRSSVSWSDPAGRGIPGIGTWQDPNSPIMALIGKIGINGQPFYVGPLSIIAPTLTDSLYLGVNDDGSFGDNYGYAVAFIFYSWVPTGLVKPDNPSNIPDQFYLNQNYPNPFNPFTIIEYTLPSFGNGKIEIFDPIGRLVRSFNTENKNAGTYKITFDARDSNGEYLASGVYYYRLVFNGNVQAKKMLLIK